MPSSDNRLTGFSALALYAWWLLRTNLGWDEANYGNRMPVVPFSDEPTLTQYDQPYIIYGFTENVDRRIHLCTSGTMTFMVRSKHLSDISKAVNVLMEGFRRYDESANDINGYINASQTNQDYFGDLTFQYTNVFYTEPGSPEKTEGGRITGTLSFDYMYTASPRIVTTGDFTQ